MTDREILDQLEQWLEAEFSRLEEIRRSPRGLTDEGEARREAIEDVLDRLRELRALADDPDLANWLTERATTTSPSRPVNEFLKELETDQ